MPQSRKRPRHATAIPDAGREHGLPYAAKVGTTGPSAIEQNIFTATEHLLATTSLDDLTVAHILDRAGISRTTFYRYFTSKHHVVSDLLTALQAELIDVMQPWYTRAASPPEQALTESISAVAAVWERRRPVLRACSENWHSDREIGERWVAMMDGFAEGTSRQIDHERRVGSAPKGVNSWKLAVHLTWSSERQLYLAGFGMYGRRMERDAVDVIVATWLGSIYRE
jgi:AcrR family transcriptional regulator